MTECAKAASFLSDIILI